VQHWTPLAAGYVMLRHSARRVRRRAKQLLQGMRCAARLLREVLPLAVVLHRRCRIKRSKTTPTTLDRWLELDPQYEPLGNVA